MSSLPLKGLVSIAVAVFALASPADATKKSKHKKVAASSTTTRTDSQHRGTNLVPAGPLYFSGVYLGDDPDPNIRFQLLRDISGRIGGDN
ncbi:MAG TPA: hypothetical protein VI358_06385 [Pseudolabrys sp.]